MQERFNEIVDHLFRHESGKMIAVLSTFGLSKSSNSTGHRTGYPAAGAAYMEL